MNYDLNENNADFVVDEWNCEEEDQPSRRQDYISPTSSKNKRQRTTESRYRKKSSYHEQDINNNRRAYEDNLRSYDLKHSRRSPERYPRDRAVERPRNDLRHRIKSYSDELPNSQERYSPELSQIYHSRYSPEFKDQESPKEEFLYERFDNQMSNQNNYYNKNMRNISSHYQDISDDEIDVGRSSRTVVGIQNHSNYNEPEGFKISVIQSTRKNYSSYKDSNDLEICVHNDRLERRLISESESESEEERRETRHRELEVLPDYIEQLHEEDQRQEHYGKTSSHYRQGPQPTTKSSIEQLVGGIIQTSGGATKLKSLLSNPTSPASIDPKIHLKFKNKNMSMVSYEQCIHCKYPYDALFKVGTCEMCLKPKNSGHVINQNTPQSESAPSIGNLSTDYPLNQMIRPQIFLPIAPHQQPMPPPGSHEAPALYPRPPHPGPSPVFQPVPAPYLPIPANYHPHPAWQPPPVIPAPIYPAHSYQPPLMQYGSHVPMYHPAPQGPPHYMQGPLPPYIQPSHQIQNQHPHPIAHQPAPPYMHPGPIVEEHEQSITPIKTEDVKHSKSLSNNCDFIPLVSESVKDTKIEPADAIKDAQSFDYPNVASASICRAPVKYTAPPKINASSSQKIIVMNHSTAKNTKPRPTALPKPKAPPSPNSLMKTLQMPWV